MLVSWTAFAACFLLSASEFQRRVVDVTIAYGLFFDWAKAQRRR